MFTTSVQNQSDITRLRTALDGAFAGRWHFDLWEAARYLRLIGSRSDKASLESILQRHGYQCEEVEAEICVPALPSTEAQTVDVLFH